MENNKGNNTMKSLKAIKFVTALTFAAVALLLTANPASAQDSFGSFAPIVETADAFVPEVSIPQDWRGLANGAQPIDSLIVTVIDQDTLSINYTHDNDLGLTIYPHSEAFGMFDFTYIPLSIDWQDFPMGVDHVVDVSSLPGNTFYVMVGDSTPTQVIFPTVEEAPVDEETTVEPVLPTDETPECEENCVEDIFGETVQKSPCLVDEDSVDFQAPPSGTVLTSDDECNWGVIEFIPGDCLSGEIRFEFASPVPENVFLEINGTVLIDEQLSEGLYIMDVSDLLVPDYNDVYAYVGDTGQAFFVIGSLEPCAATEEVSEVEVPETEETPETEKAPVVEETPVVEAPSFTDQNTLPVTGSNAMIMFFIAAVLVGLGFALITVSKRRI
jgi:hypothetical protein